MRKELILRRETVPHRTPLPVRRAVELEQYPRPSPQRSGEGAGYAAHLGMTLTAQPSAEETAMIHARCPNVA